MACLNTKKIDKTRYVRVLFLILSFILFITLCLASCGNKNGVSSKISELEPLSSISFAENDIISSSAAKTEESSSEPLRQDVTSKTTTSKNASASVNQGTVAQTGIFDVLASAEKWTYRIDKSKPVPLQPCVDNSFFNNVMFVGDSITTGIDLYDIVSGCSVVAYTGINTSTILSKAVIRNQQGTKVTFLNAMKQYNPKHIYIMLGINGIAFQSKDNFLTGYRQFLDAVIAQHPNAIIYLQSILPVTNKKQNSDSRFANSKINSYNEGIQALALEKGVYYLNVAEAFKDAYGNLPSKASSDGVHFGPAHYRLWIEYLKRHTVYTGEIPNESISSSSQISTSTPVPSQTETIQPDDSQKPPETPAETSSKIVLISRPERDENNEANDNNIIE